MGCLKTGVIAVTWDGGWAQLAEKLTISKSWSPKYLFAALTAVLPKDQRARRADTDAGKPAEPHK